MLKITIIVVDRTRASFLREGESFYLHRLRRYAHVEWIEVKPASIKKGKPSDQILAKEGSSILRRCSTRDYIISLDRSGKAHDSEELAAMIDRLSFTHSHLTFVIGGPLGLAKTVLERTHETFSLSRLTLTHEMSRLLLLEQLYRSFTIIKGEKYHK